jgi:hypothetical protein
VVCLCFSKHDNIITDIERTLDVMNVLIDDILENLAGRFSAEIEPGISAQSFVGGKCSDIAALW